MKFNPIEFRHALLEMHQERGELLPLTTSDAEHDVIVRERNLIMGIVRALDRATEEES